MSTPICVVVPSPTASRGPGLTLTGAGNDRFGPGRKRARDARRPGGWSTPPGPRRVHWHNNDAHPTSASGGKRSRPLALSDELVGAQHVLEIEARAVVVALAVDLVLGLGEGAGLDHEPPARRRPVSAVT